MDLDVEDDLGQPPGEKDAWASYQQHRKIRSFGDGSGVGLIDGSGEPIVKQEEAIDDEEEEDDTPRRASSSRPGKRRASAMSASDKASPAISRSGSGADLSGRHARKRRGEEQLLLDDHLLPEEMKRTGQLTGKRDRPVSGTVPTIPKKELEPDKESEDITDEPDEIDDADRPVEAPEVDAVDEDAEQGEDGQEEGAEDEDEDEEGEDGGEVTRCVCQREGELFS